MPGKNLINTKNKIGRFTYSNINTVGGYPCYYLKGDVFEEVDEILGGLGLAVYYGGKDEDPISIYHFNGSTVRITTNELTNETNLSIFGNEEKTLKKLEEAFE